MEVLVVVVAVVVKNGNNIRLESANSKGHDCRCRLGYHHHQQHHHHHHHDHHVSSMAIDINTETGPEHRAWHSASRSIGGA